MVLRAILTSCFFFSCASLAPAADAAKRYTVDDMLATEEIGKARFDPSGNRLIFEYHGPFEKQSDFSREWVIGETRSKIYAADLSRDDSARLLFAQQASDGYALGSISPDGAYAVYGRVSGQGVAAGIVSLRGGGGKQFDFSPDINPYMDIPWIGRRLAFEALKPGEVPLAVGVAHEDLERLVEKWQQRNAGRVVTASRIGSGRFSALPNSEVSLILVGAEDSSVTTLSKGKFNGWFPSPDGTSLAVLRQERLAIDPNNRIEHDIGGVQHRLLIFDTKGNKQDAAADICAKCDVLSSSLNWSPEAPLLSFYARDDGKEWSEARFHVYDRRTGKSRAVALGPLKTHVDRSNLSIDVRSAWIGSSLAIFAINRNDAAVEKPRGDWYVVEGSRLRNLTAEFSGEPPQLFGVGRQSLLLLHDGDAWSVDVTGKRINLTPGITEMVKVWREPSPYMDVRDYNVQPTETATLQIASQEKGGPSRLLFIDLESRRIETITAPSGSVFIAASPVAHRAALIEKSGNVSTLVVRGADGSRRELQTLNAHLKDVVGGTPVRIDHKGPKGDDRMSWLLLPPGYKPGTRLATVVNVYPGTTGRETFNRWTLDKMHALNDHILAAHGYAILYPSIPVAYETVARDPLTGLTEEVFAAVDAAVSKNYIDPNRLAIQGQSYGGYATGALVGLTDRFKSAVAQAGFFNLISSYGQHDIRRRLAHEKTGLDLFAVGMIETGHGGMGSPPWDDPERYLRNSPLMYVENIKTPVMLISGDLDYISTTQSEELFTALTRLDKDAVLLRYYGEDHVLHSPANIRDMWKRIIDWYETTLGPPTPL